MKTYSMRPAAILAVIVVGAAALATLLYVSASRDFVPGIVELGVLLAALAVGAIAVFMGIGGRRMADDLLLRPTGRQLTVLALCATLMAVTAGLAVASTRFPWPVALLTILVFGAIAYVASGRDSTEERQADGLAVVPRAVRGITHENASQLRNVDVFRALSEREVMALAEIGEVTRVREGSPMGVEGMPGGWLYVVLSGRAELSAGSGADRIPLRMVGPGEAFPLAALLGDGTLISSGRALTDMEVWRVQRERLIRYCSDHPRTGSTIYKTAATLLAERYRNTLWRLNSSVERVLRDNEMWANV